MARKHTNSNGVEVEDEEPALAPSSPSEPEANWEPVGFTNAASRVIADPETGLATVELADGAHGIGISPAIAARISEDHPAILGYGDDGSNGVWVATMSHHFHRYQYVDGAGVLHFRQ